MSDTTIQLPESTKQKLRDARLEHETNYGQTIERLLGGSDSDFCTEEDVREIVRDELASGTFQAYVRDSDFATKSKEIDDE